MTLEDRKKIEEYRSSGLSLKNISGLMGRSLNGVAIELSRGGGVYYNAEKAQGEANKRRKEKYDLIARSKCREYNNKTLSERLKIVEKELDIIKELLKQGGIK